LHFLEETLTESNNDDISTDIGVIEDDVIGKVNKGVNNVPKMKSVRTQYNVSHFQNGNNPSDIPPKTLKVKIISRKKAREVGVNTEFSFNANYKW
jgi:hypothetical protein